MGKGNLLKYWVISIVPALFFIITHGIWFLNYIIFFPTMIVHEIGHTFFGFLAMVPGVSFFFASFSLSEAPLWKMALIFLPLEAYAIYYFLRIKKIWSVSILFFIITLQALFLIFVTDVHWFVVFGGLGGELVLPFIALVILFDLNKINSQKALLYYTISCVVYWHSFFSWILAWLKMRPIPYPRDSEGAIALFQDPFSMDGRPVGDIDKLILQYGWTENVIIKRYLLLAILVMLAYIIYLGSFQKVDFKGKRMLE